LINIGQNPSDLSNIPDIEKIFSPFNMFLLVTIQPIGEEIYFRGFLFEKIECFSGGYVAITVTSILFGIAHMGYGKIFPVLMPIVMGFVLGSIVYKTKNLYSAIIAHVAFNFTSLFLAYFGQKLLENIALNL
jgi:membrane protease YdiL (CAAX protease family)